MVVIVSPDYFGNNPDEILMIDDGTG